MVEGSPVTMLGPVQFHIHTKYPVVVVVVVYMGFIDGGPSITSS